MPTKKDTEPAPPIAALAALLGTLLAGGIAGAVIDPANGDGYNSGVFATFAAAACVAASAAWAGSAAARQQFWSRSDARDRSARS